MRGVSRVEVSTRNGAAPLRCQGGLGQGLTGVGSRHPLCRLPSELSPDRRHRQDHDWACTYQGKGVRRGEEAFVCLVSVLIEERCRERPIRTKAAEEERVEDDGLLVSSALLGGGRKEEGGTG